MSASAIKKAIITLIAIFFLLVALFVYQKLHVPDITRPQACTLDAMICPDGSAVGRSGPNCEFAKCPDVPVATEPEVTSEEAINAEIAAKAEHIVLAAPAPYDVVSSPLAMHGKAQGTWFFEASFPVELADANGNVIAQGVATAEGDWMTEDFVPFTASLTFIKPETGIEGTLILKKDNPSGLPEKDDALKIPVRFGNAKLEVI